MASRLWRVLRMTLSTTRVVTTKTATAMAAGSAALSPPSESDWLSGPVEVERAAFSPWYVLLTAAGVDGAGGGYGRSFKTR